MTTQLVRYEAAKSALVAARSLDEVKEIRNQAEGMRAYARVAKDHEMEINAIEIRHLSEFRLGEMIIEAKTSGIFFRGRAHKVKRSDRSLNRILLREIGVDHKMSAHVQRLASSGSKAFEKMLAQWRERMLSDPKKKIIIDIHMRSAPTKSKRFKELSSTICAGDLRFWSVAKLRRVINTLTKISNYCGGADDGASVGDCISNATLDALCRGEKE